MAWQERNLSQEFETLLNGRSILDLTGKEAAMAVNILTQIVKNKPLKLFTEVELNALIEELSEIVALNLFKGNLSNDWKKQTLDWFDNCNERDWGWDWASILDLQLHDVEMWDNLDIEDKETVAKAIIDHLEEQTN